MLALATDQLVFWMAQFFLPFFRIAAFFASVPIFGNQLVPLQVRLGFALICTAVVAPLVSAPALESFLSVEMVLLVINQVLLGVAMGFFVQLFFHIFVLAGQMIAMQMGLGFASMVDPTNGVSVAVVSQFYVVLVTLLFLAFNGHLVLIQVIVESFRFLPLDQVGMRSSMLWLIVETGVWMFSSAFLLALPAVSAILIVNFAFGVMTRAAPQLNIFSLGFPFTLIFGLFILWVALAGFLPQYQKLSEQVFEGLYVIIGR